MPGVLQALLGARTPNGVLLEGFQRVGDHRFLLKQELGYLL